MLDDIARLAERFNMRSQSRAWYQKTRTWYSIYQFTHCSTLQASDYDVIFEFCVDSASLATSFKKVQRHHDLNKRRTMFIRQRAAIQLIKEVTDK